MKYDSLIAKEKGLSLKNMKPVTELKRSIEKVEKEKKQQYQELLYKQQLVKLSSQRRETETKTKLAATHEDPSMAVGV